MSSLIGIDLGGTRIKGVLLDESGKILQQLYTPTNDSSEQGWKQAIASTVQTLQKDAGKSDFVIGLSAPGLPNELNTCIAHMPGRMQGLEGFVWSDFLNQPAWVANDAIAAMAGEARFGVAKGKKNVILLTLGTGVGGAILIDGRIYQGAFQKAGHLGHTTVDSDGENDVTNLPGSLEDAIGNCTIKKRSLGKYDYTHQLLEDYKNGDHFARWLWLTSVRKLAIGIASFTNALSPELVVLGGGITEAGDDLFEPLKTFMALYEWRAGGNKTEIVKAHYGDLSGAIGAASFALMQKENHVRKFK
jgi:glucokinase